MKFGQFVVFFFAMSSNWVFGCEPSLLEIASRVDNPTAYSRVKNSSRCEGLYGGFRNADANSILSLVKFHSTPFEGSISSTEDLMLIWDKSYSNNLKLTGSFLRPNFFYRMDDYKLKEPKYKWPLSDLHEILEFPKNVEIDLSKIGIVLASESKDSPFANEYVAVSMNSAPESNVYDIGFVANEDIDKLEWHVLSGDGATVHKSNEITKLYLNHFINIEVEKDKIHNSDFFKVILYSTLSNGTKPVQEYTFSGLQQQ